ncbi:MAG: hypothetical protein AAF989_16935, partial [Planctomycetota bacterium]
MATTTPDRGAPRFRHFGSPLNASKQISSRSCSITAIHKYNLLKEKVYRNRIPDRGLVDGTLAEISLGPLLGDRFMMLQDRELICLDA